MECGFSIDGGWILMEDDSLCGGRTLQEGLHARFARMHIWAVIRFASNGPNGMEGFRLRVDGLELESSVCVEGALYKKDYMLALLACIFGP
ncbi:hypothetical protein KV69_12590 [Listeria monocytogenes]|nr:hypothetical protein [Listeria monocytogenes]